ncbi:hypothetical protein DFH09DRAFT_1372251 [Mycena vulgaris]|nr:hypothetical protein DFH09DRAFT_1372251 [Mycena vulgaris]
MSLFVEGISVPRTQVKPRFTFSPFPRIVVFNSFFRAMHSSNAGLLITTLVPTNGPSSSLIHCLVSPDASHDVVLGFDWASRLWDSLISLGFCIDSSFEAWRYSLTRVISCLLSPPLTGQTP